MKIVINGKSEDLPDGMTVKSLLESKGINPQIVACELNLNVVRRMQLAEAQLKDGDQLEIIRIIGGG